jgi:hypothetical protein
MVNDEHEREVGYCGGFESQRVQVTPETEDGDADQRASSQSVGGSTEVRRSGRGASGGERDSNTSGEGGEDRQAEKSEPERVVSDPSARRLDTEDDADEAAAGGGSRSPR